MARHLLLLLTLLGAGSTLQLWERVDAAAPIPLPARARRQVALEDYEDEDYPLEATDPPETLSNHTRAVAADPQLLTTVGTSEQSASAGPGTLAPATVEATAGHSAGLGAGGTVAEEPRTGMATPGMPVTVKLATELTSAMAPITGAPTTVGPLPVEAVGSEDLSTGPAVTEAEITPPAATKAETSPPAATEAETNPPAANEAETNPPAATEAETSPPAATEAQTSPPAATEAETSPPAATEAETSPPAATEAETSPPATTEAVFVKAVAVEAASTEPLAAKPLSTEAPWPAAPVTYKGAMATTLLAESTLGSREVALPGSPATPGPSGASGLIPVKQCLLAILVLALVATVFLVCTVVLAVRLSRKSHTYPVRSYSPTEMVCISALLPDAAEGAPPAANGGLPKSQGLRAAAEDREGDDLTLHSFLP